MRKWSLSFVALSFAYTVIFSSAVSAAESQRIEVNATNQDAETGTCFVFKGEKLKWRIENTSKSDMLYYAIATATNWMLLSDMQFIEQGSVKPGETRHHSEIFKKLPTENSGYRLEINGSFGNGELSVK